VIRCAWRALVPVALAACVSGCNPKVVQPDTTGCVLNSDCDSPLVCVLGTCHDQCEDAHGCPQGQQCVAIDGGNVCVLPSESTCADGGACLGDDAGGVDGSGAQGATDAGDAGG
jgi:hypothetical protein